MVGVPRIQHVTVNTAVLLFALAASIGAGVLSGLLPCLWSSRPDLMGALREGRSASSNSRGGARLRGVLILTEVALAFVLTIAAGLMMQSFSRLLHVNSGFDPHNVLTFSVSLPDSYIEGVKASDITPPPRLTAFYDGLVARIARLPGVASVGVTSGLPLAGGNWIKFLSFDDRPAPASIDG